MKKIAMLAIASAILSGCVTDEHVSSSPGKPVVKDTFHYFAAWLSEDGKLYEAQAGRGKWVIVPHGTIFYSGSPTTK